MSWVTNVMLSFPSPRDRVFVDELNDRTTAHSSSADNFGEVSAPSGAWGGAKNPECRVFATSLNHYDLAALITKIEQLGWTDRRCVQVFIKDQQDCCFGVWMFDGDGLHEVLPPFDYDGNRVRFNANALRSPQIQDRFRT